MKHLKRKFIWKTNYFTKKGRYATRKTKKYHQYYIEATINEYNGDVSISHLKNSTGGFGYSIEEEEAEKLMLALDWAFKQARNIKRERMLASRGEQGDGAKGLEDKTSFLAGQSGAGRRGTTPLKTDKNQRHRNPESLPRPSFGWTTILHEKGKPKR